MCLQNPKCIFGLRSDCAPPRRRQMPQASTSPCKAKMATNFSEGSFDPLGPICLAHVGQEAKYVQNRDADIEKPRAKRERRLVAVCAPPYTLTDLTGIRVPVPVRGLSYRTQQPSQKNTEKPDQPEDETPATPAPRAAGSKKIKKDQKKSRSPGSKNE